MNDDTDPFAHEYRLSSTMLICSGIAPALSLILAAWCAVDGTYMIAFLSAFAAAMGLIAIIQMKRTWMVVHEDYIEFRNGFSSVRRVNRAEIASVGCQSGRVATLTLADGAILPLPAPGTTPSTLCRALDWWFKHPEHETS